MTENLIRIVILCVACVSLLSLSELKAAEEENPLFALEEEESCDPIYDPLEPWNRAVFKFNQGVDGFVLNPVFASIGLLVPPPVKDSVGNVLSNLAEPVYLINHLIQGRKKGARTAFVRFLINTTLGVCGLFDVAGAMGIKKRPNNFNQSLRSLKVKTGPYVVWPILGPFAARDSFGVMADFFMDPFNIVCLTQRYNRALNIRTYTQLVYQKQQIWYGIESVKEDALDAYAAVRSLYFQKRHCNLEPEESGP